MKKICPKCKVNKPLSEFGLRKNGHSKDGREYTCKKCIATYAKERRHANWDKTQLTQKRYFNSPKGIYKILKRKILYYGKKSFNLDQDEFIEWYTNTPKICHYCDIPIEIWNKLDRPHSKRYKRLTIDRLNSKVGYQLDNIVLACFTCNIIKSDLLTPEEMREISQKYIKPKWNV